MKKLQRFCVLGAGSFGIALARLASANAEQVALWARDDQVVDAINQRGHHPHRLPQVSLAKNVVAYSSLKSALAGVKLVILALPMSALCQVLSKAGVHLDSDCIIVSTAKGILADLSLPFDVVYRSLPKDIAKRACFLSGPSFAIELAMGLPTAMSLASADQEAATFVQNHLSTSYCRLYRTADVAGVCCGGAMKNVIAIAAGACAGLALGKNAQASLITRGLAELSRLAVSLGAKRVTSSGLSGAGDLILSCTDDMSRNYRLGIFLASGMPLDAAIKKIGSVVEGANSAKAIPKFIERHDLELPISLSVYRVLYEKLSPKDALSALLKRDLKEEFQ